jgi:ATP-dependent DNA ligase
LSLSFQDPKDLENMITKVLKLGLEGLVLKDLMVSAEGFNG